VTRTAYDDDGYFRLETLRAIGAALRRRAGLLTICFLALATGIIASFLSTAPRYPGDVKFLIKQDRADSLVSGLPEASASGDYYRGLTETQLLSQVELLRSRDLVKTVAVQTGLAAQVLAEQPLLTEAEAEEEAADTLSDHLDVWPVKRTWLINVSYAAEDRPFTQKVLDTLSRVYLQKHLELQRPAGTYQFFDQQAEQARVELDTVRAQLAAFSTEHRVASASLEKQAVLGTLDDFDGLRRQASAQLAEADQRLARLSIELQRVPRQHTSTMRTDTGVANEIRNRILTLEMQRTQLLQKFTPAYRGVQQIEEQLREARAALDAAEQTPVVERTIAENPTWQWLDTEVARTRAEHAALTARVQSLGASVAEYRDQALTLGLRESEQEDLARELKVAEDKYLLYAQKREEARISDELDRTRIANVVVAEGPIVALEPDRDPSLAFLPLLLVVALFLSGGAALAVDALSGPRASTLRAAFAAPATAAPAFQPAGATVSVGSAAARTAESEPAAQTRGESEPGWTGSFEGALRVADAKSA
jgi:uncharacterized protein involved in exopolysaccharide biosynthesis